MHGILKALGEELSSVGLGCKIHTENGVPVGVKGIHNNNLVLAIFLKGENQAAYQTPTYDGVIDFNKPETMREAVNAALRDILRC